MESYKYKSVWMDFTEQHRDISYNLTLVSVQERAASLEHCPWCTSKGLTYALRSYRINLHESITLCTNPQCLFPLVSRSLEDVLAGLDPVKPDVGNKRKKTLPPEKEESIKRSPKRLRSSELDSPGTQSVTDALVSQAEQCAEDTVSTGQRAAPRADGEAVNGYRGDFDGAVAETKGWEPLQGEDVVLEKTPDKGARAEGSDPPTRPASAGHLQSSSELSLTADGDEPALPPHSGALGLSEAEGDFGQAAKSRPEVLDRRESLPSNQSGFSNEDISEQTARTEQKSPTADVTTRKDAADVKSGPEGSSSAPLAESEELVSVPNQIFWRNSDSLCWLDSLLVALVNCKSLRKRKPRDEPEQATVWHLMRGYEDVCAAIQVHQQTGRNGAVTVPNHALQKANADLQSLRMSAFKLLQPKLHCKLGQRETPVFAMPLLLTTDSWAEPLFQATFRWEFRCSECKAASEERFTKTLPTFTRIVPDWRPLHAVHVAPCNVCCRKNQRRTMVLESVPPVFALHFVEGLPDNDVGRYTFSFDGKRYSVTTVIQYDHQLRHFVTWICGSDGSWLEYDDLKHPDCETHQKLPVPAQEMHVVFWEAAEDEEPRFCSPSSTFSDRAPTRSEAGQSLSDKYSAGDEPSPCSPDQSLLTPHNDTDIVCALTPSEDGGVMDTTLTAGLDTSIGSTTLLDTFEGLSHSDIITLTLVELKPDSEMTPANDDEQTQDSSGKNEEPEATPDSSSAVLGGEMRQGPDVRLPTTPSSSGSESGDGSSSDPTFVPGARRGRGRGRGAGRGRAVSRQRGRKAASSLAAPDTSPPVPSEPPEVISNSPAGAAAQENAPSVETTQQTSTEASPPATSQGSPAPPLPLDQNARLSFLLSKHPLHVHKSIVKPAPAPAPTPVTQVKPPRPLHSTPAPVRRQQVPAVGFPKPQLRSDESEGLPLKAAEMYVAFGAKSSSPPSPLPPPALPSDKSKPVQPIVSHHQTSLTSAAVAPGALLPAPRAKGLPEISSSKKQVGQSSKAPPGLSDTDALRYKLMKKLKAKKRKLAKLNELLGHSGGASLRPDSTDLSSPNTVTSSTYDGSACDDFLSDLLSPATTASNLSPDSTGPLEMLASGRDGVEWLDCGVGAVGGVAQTHGSGADAENFLEDFLSQAVSRRATEMESEALSALELFI